MRGMPRAVRSRDLAHADSRILRALADPTRRRLLHLLGDGEARAGDLAGAFAISRPAVSKHLRVLLDAGLVSVRRAGRERWYAIVPGPLREAAARVQALDALLSGGLERLGGHLAGAREGPRDP